MARFHLDKLIRKVTQNKELQDGIFMKQEFMRDNVSKEEKKDLEDFYTAMERFIKDTGIQDYTMGKENMLINAKTCMKVNGKMEKEKGSEKFFTIMAHHMKANGIMGKKMGLEKKYLQIKMCMKVNGKKGKKTEKELLNLILQTFLS